MTDKDCKLCSDGIIQGDMYVALRVGVEGEREDVEGVTYYHAGCFMDIVNVDNTAVSRTAIMKGQVEKYEDKDGNIKLDPGKHTKESPISRSRLREHRD